MIKIFNNSMFETWSLCEEKFYFKYIRGINIPQNDKLFELGKKVHAMINYYLQGHNMNLLVAACDKETLNNYQNILNHKLLSQKVFLTEWGFNVNIGDTQNILAGRIDAIFFDEKNNIYTIADWKSGMNLPDKNSFQALIYMYSFYKAQKDLNIDITPEQIKFIFIQTTHLQECEIQFSTELKNKIEKYFLKIIMDMNKTIYQKAQDLKTCKNCEYNFVCKKEN